MAIPIRIRKDTGLGQDQASRGARGGLGGGGRASEAGRSAAHGPRRAPRPIRDAQNTVVPGSLDTTGSLGSHCFYLACSAYDGTGRVASTLHFDPDTGPRIRFDSDNEEETNEPEGDEVEEEDEEEEAKEFLRSS